jgi:hypothetical protein
MLGMMSKNVEKPLQDVLERSEGRFILDLKIDGMKIKYIGTGSV